MCGCGADWSSECWELAETWEKVGKDLGRYVNVARFNYEKSPGLAKKLSTFSVPMIYSYVDGVSFPLQPPSASPARTYRHVAEVNRSQYLARCLRGILRAFPSASISMHQKVPENCLLTTCCPMAGVRNPNNRSRALIASCLVCSSCLFAPCPCLPGSFWARAGAHALPRRAEPREHHALYDQEPHRLGRGKLGPAQDASLGRAWQHGACCVCAILTMAA